MKNPKREKYCSSECYVFKGNKVRKSVAQRCNMMNGVLQFFILSVYAWHALSSCTLSLVFVYSVIMFPVGFLYHILCRFVFDPLFILYENKKYRDMRDDQMNEFLCNGIHEEDIKSAITCLKEELKSYDKTVIGYYLTKENLKMLKKLLKMTDFDAERQQEKDLSAEDAVSDLVNETDHMQMEELKECIYRLVELKKICPKQVYKEYDEMLEEMQKVCIYAEKDPQIATWMDKIVNMYIPEFESLIHRYVDLCVLGIDEKNDIIRKLVLKLTAYIHEEEKHFSDSMDMEFLVGANALLNTIGQNLTTRKGESDE